jgi:Rrf2 family iron-sulfur cluster assembly transcriptional regulator
MAMVELAARQQGESEECGAVTRPQVSLAEIAQAQRLSLAYLEQLFGPLRRAGLVASVRGPGGGYMLARPARDISIAVIVEAVDESIQATRCEEGGPGCLAANAA